MDFGSEEDNYIRLHLSQIGAVNPKIPIFA